MHAVAGVARRRAMAEASRQRNAVPDGMAKHQWAMFRR